MKKQKLLLGVLLCTTAIALSSCGETAAETNPSSETVSVTSAECTMPPTVTPALESTSKQEPTPTTAPTPTPTPTPVPEETEAVAQSAEHNEADDSRPMVLTEKQAYDAVINRNRITGLGNDGEQNTVGAVEYWCTSTNEDGIIVVLYRSFTGALIRYYVDPVTGETYVTEWVSGIIDEETRNGETFNAWDYFVP